MPGGGSVGGVERGDQGGWADAGGVDGATGRERRSDGGSGAGCHLAPPGGCFALAGRGREDGSVCVEGAGFEGGCVSVGGRWRGQFGGWSVMVARRGVADVGGIPGVLCDHTAAVWRDPVAFSAWCRRNLTPQDWPGLSDRLGPESWWGARFDFARTRWAVRHGFVRGAGGQVLDAQRLEALGSFMSGSLNRAADRAGVDLPLKRAAMAVTEADRVEARTGRRPAG